jgi:hypothetical protein
MEHHTGWLARKQAERTTFILQKSPKVLPVGGLLDALNAQSFVFYFLDAICA